MGKKSRKRVEEYGFDSSREYETRGDIGTFFGGIIVFLIGVYVIFQNVTVSSGFGFSRYIGFEPPFGLVLLPLLIGITMLFFNENSLLGWFLIVAGIIIIVVGILMGLRIRFLETTLFQTVLMYGMTSAGIGMTFKGLYGKKRR